MQWGFSKYVLLKKIAANIFNKSVFTKRKVIVIFQSQTMWCMLQTLSLNTKNNFILYRQ